MPIETNVASAKTGTKSLKTTIPQAIVEYLQLSDKDRLEWQVGIKNDEPVALVRRKENSAIQPQNFDNDLKLLSQRTTSKRETQV